MSDVNSIYGSRLTMEGWKSRLTSGQWWVSMGNKALDRGEHLANKGLDAFQRVSAVGLSQFEKELLVDSFIEKGISENTAQQIVTGIRGSDHAKQVQSLFEHIKFNSNSKEVSLISTGTSIQSPQPEPLQDKGVSYTNYWSRLAEPAVTNITGIGTHDFELGRISAEVSARYGLNQSSVAETLKRTSSDFAFINTLVQGLEEASSYGNTMNKLVSH